MTLPIVHHPAYVARLPEGHRFPMDKFGRLADVLIEEGLATRARFLVPAPAPETWLALAHSAAYVAQVLTQRVPPAVQREIGFPVEESVALRARCATAGTVLAARLALEHGIAANTAGGSHHARAEQGAGFCVFNDVAVAARVLQAEGSIGRVLILDCDVHQGDGTAAIFSGDESVFTASIHAERNYPVRKMASDLDVGLPDGMEDAAYLEALDGFLARAFAAFRADFVFYNAGVDPHRDDRLGRLSLSDEGLAARDRRVIEAARSRGLPVACVIGGGYDADIDRLARRHATVHRVATAFV